MGEVPQPVAVIGGTGDLGRSFCTFLLHHGIQTIIGSRNKEKARRVQRNLIDDRTESLIEAKENKAAAQTGKFIILTIPFRAHDSVIPEIRDSVKGKVVLDTTAPLKDANPTEYDPPDAGSAGLGVRNLLGEDVELVCGFHTISAHSLNDPESVHEGEVFYCGDDNGKDIVRELISQFGFAGHDAGDLSRSRTLERLTPMMIHFNIKYGKKAIGLGLTGV